MGNDVIADLIERLIANLVSNATRDNVTGGRIEVATRTEAEHAALSVANTGRLIPAEELARLFQPFQPLGTQPRARTDGPGLGLAIDVSFPATVPTSRAQSSEQLR
jgi:signal transduction histidine kinase